MKNDHVTFHISPGSVVTVLVILAIGAALFYLRDLVLIVLTAIVIASAIEPAVSWCMKRRIPRVLGVIFVYLAVFGVFFGVLYALVPPLLDDAGRLFERLPEVLNTIELPDTGFLDAGSVVQNLSIPEAIDELKSVFTVDTSQGIFAGISTIFGGVLSFFLIIVLSFYFAVRERGIDDFLRVVTPLKHEEYVVDLWQRSKRKIGLWMQGQIILSVIVVVLVYLGLTLFGVPYALLLAISAGLFELIPVFGSILAAIPTVSIAFIDGGTTLALLVLGFYIIVNQFQGNLIYPLVVKKVVGVPPLLVILGLVIGAQLAGFLGIILSVPIVATLQEFVSDLDKGKRRMGAAASNES